MSRTQTITFRQLNEDDLDAVMTIEKGVYTHGWSYGIFKDCLQSGYHCLAIELNQQFIGYIIVSIVVGEAHILNIAIDRVYQNQGLGRAAVTYILDLAIQMGAETVFLEVRPSNTAAINLYEKLGFNQVGLRHNYYPADNGREDAIIMAIALNR